MKKEAEKAKIAEWILRIGVFGTFLGHGIFALMIKQSWILWKEALIGQLLLLYSILLNAKSL